MKAVDHAFCINLDRRPDRLEGFRERLPAAMAGMVERFTAVDGRTLSPNPEIEALFAGNDFNFRRNAIGCSLSHFALWRLIASDDYPYERTVIFEDDVWFSKRFLSLWNNEMAPMVPGNFDLFYLGGLLGPATIQGMVDVMQEHDGHIEVPLEAYIDVRESACFGRPIKMQFCTYSYVVSKKGAQKLCSLVQRDKFQRGIDWFMIDRWHEMKVYATVPLLCWAVFQEGSDILLDYETLNNQMG